MLLFVTAASMSASSRGFIASSFAITACSRKGQDEGNCPEYKWFLAAGTLAKTLMQGLVEGSTIEQVTCHTDLEHLACLATRLTLRSQKPCWSSTVRYKSVTKMETLLELFSHNTTANRRVQ